MQNITITIVEKLITSWGAIKKRICDSMYKTNTNNKI